MVSLWLKTRIAVGALVALGLMAIEYFIARESLGYSALLGIACGLGTFFAMTYPRMFGKRN
jgi:hypothetical protein